jgi:hypothetical protein
VVNRKPKVASSQVRQWQEGEPLSFAWFGCASPEAKREYRACDLDSRRMSYRLEMQSQALDDIISGKLVAWGFRYLSRLENHGPKLNVETRLAAQFTKLQSQAQALIKTRRLTATHGGMSCIFTPTPPFPPIAFFCLRLFFRIEIFQWVTADSNKKNTPQNYHQINAQYPGIRHALTFRNRWGAAKVRFRDRSVYSTYFCFKQLMSAHFCCTADSSPLLQR